MLQVGDIWTFSLRQSLFNQLVVNTFAMRAAQMPTAISETDFVNEFFTDASGIFNTAGNLRLTIRGAQSNEVRHVDWFVKRVTQPTTQTFIRVVTTNNLGAIASTCETANLALSIWRRGIEGGRRNQGRVAIAGIPTSEMSAGVFDQPAINDGNLIAANLGGAITTANNNRYEIGYFSPAHEGLNSGVAVQYPAKFTHVTTTRTQTTVRVQRSRTVGVGL